MRELLSAVVAADHGRCAGRTLSRRAGAADELPGSAGGHGAQKKAYGAAELNQPPTRSPWRGCAGGAGVMLELLQLASATRAAASTMSTPTRDFPV